MTERWQEIAGYEGLYEVSSLGNVRRIKPYRNTKPGGAVKAIPLGAGYLHVSLSKDNVAKSFMVHRLAARAFYGPFPLGKCVNHINGVKTNNNVENLEYISSGENNRHANLTGLNRVDGEHNPAAKLTADQVRDMRSLYIVGASTKQVRAAYPDMGKVQISGILRGDLWRNVDELQRLACAEQYKRRATSGKLSPEDVAAIKALLGSIPKAHIAKRFGVTDTAIRAIERGLNHGAGGHFAMRGLQ